jgi:phage terminase small subunit
MSMSEGKYQAMLFRREEVQAAIEKLSSELHDLNEVLSLAAADRYLESQPEWKQKWMQSMFDTRGTNSVPRPYVNNNPDIDCF